MAIVFDRPAIVDPYGIGALGTALGQGLGKGMVQQQEATTLEQILNPILNNPNPQTADLLKAVLGIAQAPVSPETKQTAMYGLHSASLRPQSESKIIEWWDAEGKKHRDAVAPGEHNQKMIEIERQGGSLEKPSRMPVFNMKTGKKAGTIVVQENQIDQKEADLNQKNLTLNAPEGSDKTKEVLITNGKRTKLHQLKPGEEIPEGWRIRSESESKPEKLNLSDVRGAYGMEMQSIKTRMLIDMAPEERGQFSNLPPEHMLAMILAGGGKSLSPEKKEQYINEIKQVDEYYGNLSQQVLGRKGVRMPKSKEKPQFSGRDVSPAVSYLKEAKTKEEAITRIKSLAAQGWTEEELEKAAKGAGWE